MTLPRFAPQVALSLLLGAATSIAATVPGGANYTQDATRSRLEFQFRQAGADAVGRFGRFTTTLATDAAGRPVNLRVSVEVGSLDTQDAERDSLLRGPDLFNVARFPRAEFASRTVRPMPDGRLAIAGTLTLRGVRRDLVLPVHWTPAALSGAVTLKRLDFGVGQGDWRSTEWVANEVQVRFQVALKSP